MPSDRVRKILPRDTATTWDVIAPLVPPGAYLGGGVRAYYALRAASRPWRPSLATPPRPLAGAASRAGGRCPFR